MQSISYLMMVRPSSFGSNEQTAVNNFYQKKTLTEASPTVAQRAVQEFDRAVSVLRAAGISVLVLEDSQTPVKPDSIFPNNWISTHSDGTIVLYPMFAENRRTERRPHLLDELASAGCTWQRVLDLSTLEQEGHYLEGTGSIVLDHLHRVAYASLSERTHSAALAKWAAAMDYTVNTFSAMQHVGEQLQPVYHTNVVLSIGETCAIVATEMIEEVDRAKIISALSGTGRRLLEITEAQVNAFCGNALEVTDDRGTARWIVSSSAWGAYTEEQKEVLSAAQVPLVLDITTIETIGGGSARCMLAEIFLPLEIRQ